MNLEGQVQSKLQHKVNVDEYNQDGWNFISTQSAIFTSKDNDMLQDLLTLQAVPDIVFGNNIAVIMNAKLKFAFFVNAKDALFFCNYANRQRLYVDMPSAVYNYNIIKKKRKTKLVNHISVIPEDVKLKHSTQWSKNNQNPEIKQLDRISDPFYSSPYMGSIVNDQQIKFWLQKFEEVKMMQLFFHQGKSILETQLTETIVKNDSDYLRQVFNSEPSAVGPSCELTSDEIPLGNLTETNPILWACYIPIYEDEICDSGNCNSEFRFRVMKDCFFGLLRQYLRVDEVIIRIYDTRIYHDFKWDYMIREFTAKEASWSDIKSSGFNLSPQWSVDPQQSFIIQNHIPIIHSHREKIYFSQ